VITAEEKKVLEKEFNERKENDKVSDEELIQRGYSPYSIKLLRTALDLPP
jgi:hypothetical protein